MMRFLLYLLVGVLINQTPDLPSAYISFEINHLGLLTVEGSLDEVSGLIEKISEEEWSVAGEINVTSIKTGDASRDETILTEQYLNASTYPTIPFKGKISLGAEGNYSLDIEAEVRGLNLSFSTRMKIINGVLVSEPVVIDREKVGLDFGAMDTLIGEEIRMQIHSGIGVDVLRYE